MDALMSLPVMGYFLMPGMTTWSTSLNLLFFYMTWSTLVYSQTPLRVEVIGSLGVRALFFLLPATVFLLFDSLLPSLAVGVKTQGAPALPTRSGGVRGASRGGSRTPWYKVVGLSLFNVCLGVAIQAGVEVLFTDVFRIRSALKISTTLPLPMAMLKDVARGYALREILQYYIHRFILHPKKPSSLSNLHASYHHSQTSPYAFVTSYDHPLPYLLWRFLPVYLPALLFRIHILTYLLLLSLVSLEETLSYSGYTIIPGIILGGITRRQDLHMESRGKGNFAPWGFLDWLHGTGIGGDVIEDVRDEAQIHDVKGRSRRAAKSTKDAGKEAGRAWYGRRKTAKKN